MKPIRLKFSFFILCCLFSIQVNSQTQSVKIDLYSNGNKLNAEIFPASGEKYLPALILMHGYPGKEGDILELGKSLSALGINVLVFNYQGTWSSEGEFSFESSMQDAGSAIKFLKKKETIEKLKVDTSNIILGGYSYGGATALNAAIYNPEITRIFSIAGGDNSVFGRKMLADQNYRKFREQMLFNSYYNGHIKGDFEAVMAFYLSNLDRYDLVLNADSLKDKDILLIGGWDDTGVVLEEHIIPLYRKLQDLNANQLEIKAFNTDHYSFHNVREELTETIYRWIINKR